MCVMCRAPGTMVALVTVLESNERREKSLLAKTCDKDVAGLAWFLW